MLKYRVHLFHYDKNRILVKIPILYIFSLNSIILAYFLLLIHNVHESVGVNFFKLKNIFQIWTKRNYHKIHFLLYNQNLLYSFNTWNYCFLKLFFKFVNLPEIQLRHIQNYWICFLLCIKTQTIKFLNNFFYWSMCLFQSFLSIFISIFEIVKSSSFFGISILLSIIENW